MHQPLGQLHRIQVRCIHLPERMILPGTHIPSHKYIQKNLTFVVRSHSCVSLVFNSLRVFIPLVCTRVFNSFTWPLVRSILYVVCSILYVATRVFNSLRG